MDENEGLRNSDAEVVEQNLMNYGKNAAGKAGNAASNLVKKQIDKKRKLKLAAGNITKDGFVSPGKKFKAKKIQLQGKKDVAEGGVKEKVGNAMKAAGTVAKINANALKAAGNAAGALNAIAPGVGSAIKASAHAAAAGMEETGKNLQEKGKVLGNLGAQKIKAGEDKIKRGQILEATGKDVGDGNTEIPDQPIPDIPKIPKKLDIKTIISSAKTKIVSKLIFIVPIAVMLALIIVVCLMIGSEVKEGKKEDGNNGNVPYVITNNVLDNIIVNMNDSGELELVCKDKTGSLVSIDEAIDNALDILAENSPGTYADLGKNDKERKEFLKLLIKAEIATQYPNITGKKPKKDEISGIINVQRKDENGKVTALKYTDETSFNQMISSGSSDVLNYYTLKKVRTTSGAGMATCLVGSEALEQTWNFMLDSGCTEEGTAGLMGNLMAESGCVSVRVQGDFSNGYEYSKSYTEQVDSGAISEYDFVNNGPGGGGYGIAQWTYPTRKQNLYTYAKSKGKSIGDLQMQLEFLIIELSTGYPGIWQEIQNSSDRDYISDLVLTQFERPANIEGNRPVRRNNAASVQSTYTGTRSATSSSSSNKANENTSNSQSRTNSSDKSESVANSSDKSESATNSSDKSNSTTASSEDKNTTATSSTNSITSFDKFLFVGDSRYAGIQNQLKGLGSSINVCAVSGSTPAQWITTSSSGTGNVNGTIITLPEAGEVSNISVMLGVNATSQVSHLETVLQNLHSRYPNATIFYNSAYHVSSSYTYADAATMNANIDGLNQSISTYCNEYDWLKYVDVTDDLNDENGFLKNADSEGIHLTGEGCTTLVNNIKNKIYGNSSTASISSGSKSSSSYAIVVASSNTRKVYSVDTYDEYLYSRGTSKTSGTIITSDTRFGGTPAPEVVENSTVTTYSCTSIDYQSALKLHTLYFDFLWAVFVDTRDKDLVEDWARLAIESKIDITVYSESQSSTTSTETSMGLRPVTIPTEGPYAYQDMYNVKRKTDITTESVLSKIAITKADTWLMEYVNEAPTYEEYKLKSYEKEREKTDQYDEIIYIFNSGKERLKTMDVGAYKIERMIEDNPKISFMYDIYEYFIDKALNTETKYENIRDIVGGDPFNIRTFSDVSGEGSLGGEEIKQAGEGYNDIFKVGTRTYINYKQLQGPWYYDSLAGFPDSQLGPHGCAINSIAVILSGYGINMTPREVNDFAKSTATPKCHDITLGTLLGKKVTCHYNNGDMSGIVLEQLNSGKPCMVWSDAYSESHFFCILAISEDGRNVYVSDVGGNYPGQDRNGWQPLDFLSRVKNVFVIED